jgi:hypothetical protein
VTTLSSILHASRDGQLLNHRVVQQSNEDESMTLFSSMAAHRVEEMTDKHPMASMYVDSVQGVRNSHHFKAYAPSRDTDADRSAAAVASSLEKLFGGADSAKATTAS